MALEVPKYMKNESSFELEEMIEPIVEREKAVFYTRIKPDYTVLNKALSKGKVKK